MAGNHLQSQYVPALAEQLGKFPALKQLDVSANPCLDRNFLSIIVRALSSKALFLHHRLYSLSVIRIFLMESLFYRSSTFC